MWLLILQSLLILVVLDIILLSNKSQISHPTSYKKIMLLWPLITPLATWLAMEVKYATCKQNLHVVLAMFFSLRYKNIFQDRGWSFSLGPRMKRKHRVLADLQSICNILKNNKWEIHFCHYKPPIFQDRLLTSKPWK